MKFTKYLKVAGLFVALIVAVAIYFCLRAFRAASGPEKKFKKAVERINERVKEELEKNKSDRARELGDNPFDD